MKRTLLPIVIATLLSGCAIDGQLQNRVSTTLGCDQALYTSMYGPIGITSKIDGRDLAQMPCVARDKASAK